MSSRVVSRVAAALLLSTRWDPVVVAGEAVPGGYASVARTHGVPADILYAVALSESGTVVDALHTRRPWPWTLNVEGTGHFYASRQAAHQALQGFLAEGRRSIDVGLMQVSWRWHRDQLGDLWKALDPDHNLRVGARILATCYRERRDRWDAVGCYHAPNNQASASRYQRIVEAHWRRIAQRG